MTRLAALTAMFILLSSQAFSADAVGEWLVKDEGAKIGIQPCGENVLCGNIVWTKTPSGVDENNPDPEKRSRPILGLEILQGMKPVGPDRWEGTVYNALNGKTYKAFMTVSAENPDVLKLEGCILGGLICGGEDWTRVTETTTAGPAGGAVPPAAPNRPQPAAKARGKGTTTGSVPPAAQAAPEPAAKAPGKETTTGSVLFGTPARPQPPAKAPRSRSEAPPQ